VYVVVLIVLLRSSRWLRLTSDSTRDAGEKFPAFTEVSGALPGSAGIHEMSPFPLGVLIQMTRSSRDTWWRVPLALHRVMDRETELHPELPKPFPEDMLLCERAFRAAEHATAA